MLLARSAILASGKYGHVYLQLAFQSYYSSLIHTRAFDVIPAKGSFLLAKYYVIQARESKTRYLEKFKINISSRRIYTKLSTRNRLNTKSILHIYPIRK